MYPTDTESHERLEICSSLWKTNLHKLIYDYRNSIRQIYNNIQEYAKYAVTFKPLQAIPVKIYSLGILSQTHCKFYMSIKHSPMTEELWLDCTEIEPYAENILAIVFTNLACKVAFRGILRINQHVHYLWIMCIIPQSERGVYISKNKAP